MIRSFLQLTRKTTELSFETMGSLCGLGRVAEDAAPFLAEEVEGTVIGAAKPKPAPKPIPAPRVGEDDDPFYFGSRGLGGMRSKQ